MVISQFDYQMYQDEIRELEDEMRQLLIDMELYHQSHSAAAFTRWWTEEGREKRYFSCKGRIEQIRNFLAVAQVGRGGPSENEERRHSRPSEPALLLMKTMDARGGPCQLG